MWKNNRPGGWDKVRDFFAEANGGGDAEKTAALEDFEAGADARLKEILIELQRIYNLPDEGMFNKKLGEFIEELKEEVK